MSDNPVENDEDYDNFLRSLQTRSVATQLQQKVRRNRCPFCDNEQWLVETTTPEGILADPAPGFIMKDPRSYFGPAPSIPTLVMSCSNCGFVRLHNIAVIKQEPNSNG